MKLLALLVLLLSACTSYADPYQMRAAADGMISSTQQAANQAKAATVQAESAEESARLATAGAAQIEIDLLKTKAQATVQAISNNQAQLDAALLAGQATMSKEIYDASMTPAAQQAQATATALELKISYEAGKAARAQETALFWSGLLPSIARAITILVIALFVIVVRWAWRLSQADIIRREKEVVWKDRAKSFVGTGGGWFFVDADGKPTQVNLLAREWPRIDTPSDDTQMADSYAEETITGEYRAEPDPLRIEAIKLTSDVVTRYGDNYLDLPGWREMEWTSSRWQKGRAYLQALGLIRQEGQRWQFVAGAREVLHRLNLPHPAETSN